MKNLILTFLLALLVVLTAISVRRMVAGTATAAGQSPTLVAIGTDPVPLPPHKLAAIGTDPVPLPPHKPNKLVAIGTDPVPLPPKK
jgi:hypothetical protein